MKTVLIWVIGAIVGTAVMQQVQKPAPVVPVEKAVYAYQCTSGETVFNGEGKQAGQLTVGDQTYSFSTITDHQSSYFESTVSPHSSLDVKYDDSTKLTTIDVIDSSVNGSEIVKTLVCNFEVSK